ncbi:MAG: hypothetical protein H7Y17_14065 [Chlorobia bacterium]|nr:hypothetical protein [Fimbriimonadaceae bacterium]
MLRDIAPFLIPLVIFMIPIIAILTSHQRKMAELIHGNRANGNTNGEIEALRREVQELKQLVHQQTLQIDSISRYQLPQTSSQEKYTGV